MQLDCCSAPPLRQSHFRKHIDSLAAVDHSTIAYNKVNKVFYKESKELSALTPQQADKLRADLSARRDCSCRARQVDSRASFLADVRVTGRDVPKPCMTFEQMGFDQTLMKAIKKQNYDVPTAIQAQGALL